MQALAAHQLTDEAQNAECDLLTGFQLTDGKFRAVVLEGVADGAMQTLVAEVRRIGHWLTIASVLALDFMSSENADGQSAALVFVMRL